MESINAKYVKKYLRQKEIWESILHLLDHMFPKKTDSIVIGTKFEYFFMRSP